MSCNSLLYLEDSSPCLDVLLQIVGSNPEEQQKMFGRHFEIEDELVSHISRKSIDLLKANYRVSLNFDTAFSFFVNNVPPCFVTVICNV